MKGLTYGGIIIDLGSGAGIPSCFFLEERRDVQFVLFDLSIRMLKLATPFDKKVVGRAEELPFDDSTFDLVVCAFSFHHFSDQKKAMDEIRRVIRPKGKLYLLEIDPRSKLGSFIFRLESLIGSEVLPVFPDRIKKIAQELGFFVRIQSYGWRYSLVGDFRSYKIN
ncbi:MAG: class I SAM-dependent methyltransferase [Desulfobacterota bacterium]|nr:class I SAM-dependent methyltransferase [Thermodesulfobacteriota bacterium]MDW8002675.1 class I SAM-dependent methyltransferase [Deltaproteobacteria bacterium]